MQEAKRDDAVTDLTASPTSGGLVRSILVADDSRAHRRMLSAPLRRWGYRVFEAATGTEALALCRECDVDLVLSDWMMPGLDGLEFCRAFRALRGERYGYFILLTARDAKDDVARGLEFGADDFLTKPVSAAELRARLIAGERILRLHRAARRRNALLRDTLASLRSAQAALDRDLDEARRLQQSLVPERFRAFSGGDVALLLHPSGQVGGDLVGIFRVSETRLGLYAIDVAGHGIASALMTARLASYFSPAQPQHNVALTADEMGLYAMRAPETVCATLNGLLVGESDTQPYFTMILADCDLRTGRVRIAQAGHPSPLIQRAGGGIEIVGEGGLPVGLVPDAPYSAFDVMLMPGDRLLIHSDGITECPAADGGELEEKGLITLMRRLATVGSRDFMDALISELAAFSGSRSFPDDVSGILLERGRPGAGQ